MLSNYFQTHKWVCNPKRNTIFESQVMVYLELIAVGGRENGGGVLLWVQTNIKLSFVALYILGMSQTVVFASVFGTADDLKGINCNATKWHDNAVLMLAAPDTLILPFLRS